MAIMLLTVLLAAYSLPRTFVAQSAWEGTVTIQDGGCVDGDVELLLSAPDADGQIEGTYHYTSRGSRDGWYVGSYTMHGSWSGRWLHLNQDALDVEVSKRDTNWCMGHMDLRQRGDGLVGSWGAENCGCSGVVELDAR